MTSHAFRKRDVSTVPENMEAKKEYQRFYIFVRLQLGEGIQQIHSDLSKVFGEESLGYSTCTRWARQFDNGREAVQDEHRSGAPKTARSEKAIESVRQQIDVDPHSSIREISSILDISYGTVNTILVDDLKLRKICARWVPHVLTDDQKRQRVLCAQKLLNMFEPNGHKHLADVITGDETWIYFYGIPNKRKNMMWLAEDEPRPIVASKGFQSRKRLFTIFFNHEGPVLVDILPEKMTLTGTYYRQNILPGVIQEIEQKRPTTGVKDVLLLHDNASPHKSKVVKKYLEDQQLQVLPHPPYSPDLAPCDFWLFPTLKDRLAGRKFYRVQDLAKAVFSELKGIPKENYAAALEKWITRLRTCIQRRGEYFEGL